MELLRVDIQWEVVFLFIHTNLIVVSYGKVLSIAFINVIEKSGLHSLNMKHCISHELLNLFRAFTPIKIHRSVMAFINHDIEHGVNPCHPVKFVEELVQRQVYNHTYFDKTTNLGTDV